MSYLDEMFSVKGKVAVFSGGAGILAGGLGMGLGKAGATVVMTDIAPLDARVEELRAEGIDAHGLNMNVMEKDKIEAAAAEIKDKFGKVDILINAAGGNMPAATTSPDQSFFDVPMEALNKVVSLNLFGGGILPSQVFGKMMVANEDGGLIVNISSMAAYRPLTRVLGYAVAKAAVSNFTQWLAVDIAKNHSPKVRVNAIAPGFFLTAQNRYLMLGEDGNPTPRGQAVLAHTPAGRFGESEELISTLIWLSSPASAFITGVVVPVDGGFNAFSGV